MWTLPNILTLSRIPLMFLIVWLTYQSWQGAATLAFSIFILAALSDWLDGAIARKRGVVSNFGKFMDALTDKILVIGLMVAFVERFGLPLPFVLVTLCREFIVSGMRMVVAAKGIVVAADSGGKIKTVTQMIAIGCLLSVPMLSNDMSHLTLFDSFNFVEWIHNLGWVAFILGTYLAVWTGYRYLKSNWLVFTS
ncbi:CDP-diacylglycerol--glycerol-3-phosphate 3-phosphatidyltransferase [Verrucomicrobia bacterium IMCC26134]|nr:CDP-diacylglycerol--glycerol-3-phosphate 3-phosphatidyltransferase [Verrucomicrobia bacterium IMCC26134]